MQTAHPDAIEYATRRAAARSLTQQADFSPCPGTRADLRAQADHHHARAALLFTQSARSAGMAIITLAAIFDTDPRLADASLALIRAGLTVEEPVA